MILWKVDTIMGNGRICAISFRHRAKEDSISLSGIESLVVWTNMTYKTMSLVDTIILPRLDNNIVRNDKCNCIVL